MYDVSSELERAADDEPKRGPELTAEHRFVMMVVVGIVVISFSGILAHRLVDALGSLMHALTP